MIQRVLEEALGGGAALLELDVDYARQGLAVLGAVAAGDHVHLGHGLGAEVQQRGLARYQILHLDAVDYVERLVGPAAPYVDLVVAPVSRRPAG